MRRISLTPLPYIVLLASGLLMSTAVVDHVPSPALAAATETGAGAGTGTVKEAIGDSATTEATSVSVTAGDPVVDAALLWKKNCAACHGADAKGQTSMGRRTGVKDLTDPAVRADFDRDRMISSVTEGIPGDEGERDKKKGYGERLSKAEISALVDFILNLAS